MADQMFTELVDKATNSPTPFRCESILNELYEIQAMHIDLKDKDTRKLESKLKKHKSLEHRLEILNEELR